MKAIFKHLFFFFSFIVLFCAIVYGQTVPVMINYTVDDGLPSSETHDILQDSKGYIWIATDRGVSRYNGYEFENFTTEDGLTDNVVFRLQEDSEGRIWFHTMNFKLCYFEDGEVKPYTYNDKLMKGIKHLKAFALRFNQLIIDSTGTVHASFAQSGGLKITKYGEVSYYEKPLPKRNVSQVVFDQIDGKQFVLSYYDVSSNYFCLIFDKEHLIDSSYLNLAESRVHTNHGYYSDFNLIFSFRYAFKYSTITSNPLQLIHDSQGEGLINTFERIDSSTLWLGSGSNGIYTFHNDTLQHNLLRGVSISSIHPSNYGIWISSLNQGIFFISRTDILTLSETDNTANSEKRITSITHNSKHIFFSNHSGLIKVYDHDLTPANTIQLNQLTFIRKLFWDNERDILWVGSNSNKLSYYSNNNLYNIIERIPSMKKGIGTYTFVIQDSTIILSTSEGYYHIKYKNNSFRLAQAKRDTNPEFNRLDFFIDHNNQIWGGGIYGLSKVNYKEDSLYFEYLGDSIPDLSLRVTCMTEKDSTLWLGTRGNGIIIYDKKSTTSFINNKIGFKPKNINAICINDDQVWVASNMGVTLITEDSLGQYTFQQINISSGLSTNEVTCLDIMGDTLLIGTKKGLNFINIKAFQLNDYKQAPIITNVSVGDKPVDSNNIEITYDNNSIEISYLTFAYGTGGDIIYQYKIAELEQEWVTTKGRTARFVALPPGRYTFKVRTLKNNGGWTKDNTIHFSVLPAIWQTWYFWVTIGVVFVVVVSTIAYSSIKSANERSEMNARIESLKQSSLSSQMNPHFVFNVLNSILTFLLTNSQRNAAKYLSSFAWLMRKTFHLSRESKVSLEEEIDVLTAYFKLEKLRIAEKVEFQLEIDSDLDVEILKVPPLILQPFVENAILHGISQDKKSIISVNLTKEDSYMKVVIEDNGIGIEKSRKEKEKHTHSKSHKSSGLDISKERIALLHKVKNEKAQVEIIDLSLIPNSHKTGTKVTFYLPLVNES